MKRRVLKRRYGRAHYSAETRALAERYRRLVHQQRMMPLSQQWKMGAALREAKARALVAMDEEDSVKR